jgi:hypothetical protein
MMSPLAAKIVLTAGSSVAAAAGVAAGFHHGILTALQNVPAWTHAHGVLSGLMSGKRP